MKVSCSECKKLFEARTRAATFCGPTCRKRASRRGPDAPSAPAEPALAPVPDVPRAVSALVAQTRRELDEAGVLESAMGMAALHLAEKLAGGRDTGSAMASLSRELRAVMAEALASGTRKADSLDELAARRIAKASGA